MTRTHLQQMQRGPSDEPVDLIPYFARSLTDVLVAIGWEGCHSEAYAKFTTKFKDRLQTVIELAFRLNKAIGEEVTSGDMEVIEVRPNDIFDPQTMQDAYTVPAPRKQGEGPVPERILCTIGLGLRLAVKKSNGDDSDWEIKTLLKPEVVPESALEDI